MTEAEVKPRSRRPLIIILGVSVFPILAAYFVYFTGIGMPSQTVNAGKFIEPALSVETLISDEQWEAFQQNKKWRIIVPISEPCVDSCEQNLYTSRQVHIRLAQRSERVERFAAPLNELSDATKAHLAKDHPRLEFVDAPLQQTKTWFAQLPKELGNDFYLLVDQEGRAMMSYDSSIHGNLILKDLKRALKYSIDYQ